MNTKTHSKLLIEGFVVCLCLTGALGQLTWHMIHAGVNASLAPAPRIDAGLAYYHKMNILVLYGGRSQVRATTKVMSDTWIFDIRPKKWRQVSSTQSPPVRFSFVYGHSDPYFYIATGEGADKVFYDDIWRFNMDQEEWEKLPSQTRPSYYTAQQWSYEFEGVVKPAERYGAAGGIFHNSSRFYIAHGFSTISHQDTLSYDVTQKGWYTEFSECHSYNPSCPHARALHGGVMISAQELLIFGGCLSGEGSGGPCPAGDTWLYNARTKQWTQVNSCPIPRIYGSMALLPIKHGQRRAILYGGVEKTKQVITTTESAADQVAVFNTKIQEWSIRKTQGTVPTKRASAAMATGPNGVFMFGGVGVESGQSLSDLYLLLGDSASADFAPELSECRATFFNWATVHGILMVLGWGFFLQWGAFIARYFKHKQPLWLHLHRLFQICGVLLVAGGLPCGILSVQTGHFKLAHAILGLVVMVLGLQQPLNVLCRPKDREGKGSEKKLCRVLWELYHVICGRLALIGGIVNISLGVFLVVAHKLVWSLWFGYVGFLVLVYILAEVRKSFAASDVMASKQETYTVNKHKSGSRVMTGYDNPALNMSDKLKIDESDRFQQCDC